MSSCAIASSRSLARCGFHREKYSSSSQCLRDSEPCTKARSRTVNDGGYPGIRSFHGSRCSSDRKRFISLQRSAQLRLEGPLLWDTASSGSHESTSPSRISTEIDSPQSGQTVSILINLPGNSQHAASDSFPHWPYHFCSPSTLILYWLGWSEKGQMVTVLYFSSTHAGYPEAIKSWRTVSASSGPIPSTAPSSW